MRNRIRNRGIGRQIMWVLALSVVVAVLGTAGMEAAAQAPIVMKIGTVNPGDSPRNIAAYEFAKVLGEASKGRIKGEVYINNQLARGEGATFEGVQLGSIDAAPVGSAPIGGMFEPLFLPTGLPFVWSSREQVWKVMDGPFGQNLLRRMENRGVKVLGAGGGWGFREMQSNKRPIYTPEDMKGQTIRVQESPIYIGMMKQLGANPVPMPWGEVYLAMQQGTVDGMESPSFTIVSDRFTEVTKYVSLTHHTYDPIVWYTNLKKYQALPPDLRNAVDVAGKAACAMDRKDEIAKNEAAFQIIRKAGVKVNEVKDLAAFQKLMGPVYDLVTAKVGKEYMDQFMAAVKAAR